MWTKRRIKKKKKRKRERKEKEKEKERKESKKKTKKKDNLREIGTRGERREKIENEQKFFECLYLKY